VVRNVIVDNLIGANGGTDDSLAQPLTRSFFLCTVGTIYTMAPQVLQGIYSSKADLWSVGVIAYMLLSASKPFYSRKRRKMIDLIMRCDYVYDAPIWKEAISDNAKDLIDKLLVVDPKQRWDAAKALKHPWLVNREQLPDEKPSEAILMQVEDSLLNYRETSALKKLALNVIAHRSSTKGTI
jgi:calcium-dependent protein kinase